MRNHRETAVRNRGKNVRTLTIREIKIRRVMVMVDTPAERLIDTVTARDANGTRYTIERWTNHATGPGEAWRDGTPVLRTREGMPVYDMTEGRYEFGDTGTLLYAVRPDTD